MFENVFDMKPEDVVDEWLLQEYKPPCDMCYPELGYCNRKLARDEKAVERYADNVIEAIKDGRK